MRIKGILGSFLGSSGAPAPSNGQATQIGGVQFVGLEIGEDGVDLLGNLFQFGQAGPVLDVGLDPFVDITLGGFPQYRHEEDQQERLGSGPGGGRRRDRRGGPSLCASRPNRGVGDQ